VVNISVDKYTQLFKGLGLLFKVDFLYNKESNYYAISKSSFIGVFSKNPLNP